MIFIDSSIPMYLVGAPHPNKQRAQELIERAIESKERLVTDAEVLQEILQHYGALQRLDAVQPAFTALLGVVDAVLPIEHEDLELAKEVLLGAAGKLSARSSLHVAVMMRHGIERIMSFDRGFDEASSVERLA